MIRLNFVFIDRLRMSAIKKVPCGSLFLAFSINWEELSIPVTLYPSLIKYSAISCPVPQPRSRILSPTSMYLSALSSHFFLNKSLLRCVSNHSEILLYESMTFLSCLLVIVVYSFTFFDFAQVSPSFFFK